MPDLHLFNDIALALALAFAGGLVAHLLGLSPIVGYLLAGIVISPFTPGYEANTETLAELAELGVVFLMFGVGLHFNLRDLSQVKSIAVPGAVLQMLAAIGVALVIAAVFGLSITEGLVLGFSISIASTVVLLRGLEDRGLLESIHGRVAVGWLIVEDIATVLLLVLLPSLAPDAEGNVVVDALLALAIAGAFVAFMLIIGAQLLPRLLGLVARVGSRELFLLAVIVSAVGIAASATLFGLSVALGAFVAGVVVSETETSNQAAADVLPFRDAFAVLFFVSVGMLLDPAAILDNVGLLLAVLAAVVVGKAIVASIVAAAFPYPARTGLIVAAGLAQIGEFSFIVARDGLELGLLQSETYNVILATAIISIAINPLMFRGVSGVERALQRSGALWRWFDRQGDLPSVELPAGGHVVIAGYGRVGELSGRALMEHGVPIVVVEAQFDVARQLRRDGIPAIWGDAGNAEVLERAGVGVARLLVLTVPERSATLLAIANARRLNPGIAILTRAPNAELLELHRSLGASEVVVPEYEGGIEMMRQAFLLLGFPTEAASELSRAQRAPRYSPEEPA